MGKGSGLCLLDNHSLRQWIHLLAGRTEIRVGNRREPYKAFWQERFDRLNKILILEGERDEREKT